MSKLCDALLELDPNEVPPLVHQMLKLSQSMPAMILLKTLSKYYEKFNQKIDDETSQSELESEDLIGGNDKVSVHLAMQSEGTVIFHICQAVRMGHTISKDLIKVIKAGNQVPSLALDKFVLFLALSLTSIKQLKQQVKSSP